MYFEWAAGHLLLNRSISRMFLKCPKILSFKSFGHLLDYSYIHLLVIIINFRFICSEEKLCLSVKKSTNLMSKIVVKCLLQEFFFFCWTCHCTYLFFRRVLILAEFVRICYGCIQNSIRHLRWNVFWKKVSSPQNAPSLNTPLYADFFHGFLLSLSDMLNFVICLGWL